MNKSYLVSGIVLIVVFIVVAFSYISLQSNNSNDQTSMVIRQVLLEGYPQYGI